MAKYIRCDAHNQYSVFVGIADAGQFSPAQRVEHTPEELEAFLDTTPAGLADCRGDHQELVLVAG